MKRQLLFLLFIAASVLPSAPSMAAPWCVDAKTEQLAVLRKEVKRKVLPESRAVERVHVEGTLPHQGIYDQSVEAQLDWPVMRNLALLWQVQRDPNDLAALSRLLTDWGNRYQPSFNPIDETNLDTYIDAYAVARDDLAPPVRSIAQRFIRQLGEGYLGRMEHDFKPNEGKWISNWNSHRVKLATLAAVALEDETMLARARTQFTAHLGRNIRESGVTVDFEERDALHYVVYDLEPLTRAALAARLHGENWLDFKGSTRASLRNALDWLAPYANGDKTHEEFVHSRVKFDYQRRDAGLPEFSGIWDPARSSNLYAMASILDAKYLAISQALKPSGGSSGGWIRACWGL